MYMTKKGSKEGDNPCGLFVTDTDFFCHFTFGTPDLFHSFTLISFFYRNHLFDFLESLSAL